MYPSVPVILDPHIPPTQNTLHGIGGTQYKSQEISVVTTKLFRIFYLINRLRYTRASSSTSVCRGRAPPILPCSQLFRKGLGCSILVYLSLPMLRLRFRNSPPWSWNSVERPGLLVSFSLSVKLVFEGLHFTSVPTCFLVFQFFRIELTAQHLLFTNKLFSQEADMTCLTWSQWHLKSNDTKPQNVPWKLQKYTENFPTWKVHTQLFKIEIEEPGMAHGTYL